MDVSCSVLFKCGNFTMGQFLHYRSSLAVHLDCRNLGIHSAAESQSTKISDLL